MASSTQTRQPSRPAAHGRCRWCGLSPARSPRLLDIGGALLEITALDNFGKPQRPVHYWVRRVENGWELTRPYEDGSGAAVYHVDTSFGPDVQDWSCDCPASSYTARRICKHRMSVYHALRAAGLLPLVGGPAPFGR